MGVIDHSIKRFDYNNNKQLFSSFWWHVRESPQWLLLDFCPTFWVVVRIVLLKMECSFSDGDTQTLLAAKKIQAVSGNIKTLGASPCK